MEPSFTPWRDLPMEMRLECIKWMDFPSRMQLRATSTMDKCLVELAPKHHFDSVKIDLDLEYTSKVVCKTNDVETVEIKPEDEKRTPEFVQKANKLVFQILKFAAVDDFEFSLDFGTKEDVSEFVSVISGCSSFRFSKLALHLSNFEVLKAFLANTRNSESVELYIDGEEFTEAQIHELIRLDSVVNSKRVLVSTLTDLLIPLEFVHNWSEKDTVVGKNLRLVVIDRRCMEGFAKDLENRIISKTDKILRIRTDDDSKHILIRFCTELVHICRSYLTITVIPADLNESEYETDERWVAIVRSYAFDRIYDRMLHFSKEEDALLGQPDGGESDLEDFEDWEAEEEQDE